MIANNQTLIEAQLSWITPQQGSPKDETSGALIDPIIQILPSRMFGYPTRLMCAWEPRMMQIDLPNRIQPAPRIEIKILQDSTQSLNIQPNHFYSQLFKRFVPPIHCASKIRIDAASLAMALNYLSIIK